MAPDQSSLLVKVVAQSPLLGLEVDAEDDLQSRRYSTRRRFSTAGESPHLMGQDVKPIVEKASIVSSNSKVTGSSKRKLRAVENADTQPTNAGIIVGEPYTCMHDAKFEGKNEANTEIVTQKVKEMLQLYRKIYSRLLQEEQKLEESCKRGRLDLLALKHFKDNFKCITTAKKILGSIPGVDVGDQFNSRVELSIIGLHRNMQAGIESIKYGETFVASNIVSTGRCYKDIRDGSDVLLYSGSGGHRGECKDQKLEGGNLALKNSIDAQTPVRVIYGLKQEGPVDSQATKAKNALTYIYDGLYLVEKYWSEQGSKGFSVFKFQLRRMPKQPQLTIKEPITAEASESQITLQECTTTNGLKMQNDLRVDITQGKEKKPISLVNTIDDELPMPFTYITKMIYPSWYKPIPYRGCNCVGRCSDSVKCACAVQNGGEIPFNSEGRIIEARPLVYECGPSCRCSPSCQNRVSQHGIKFKLEIFKTKLRGWGVRSLSHISCGSFICEYTGEMLQEVEAETRKNDEYLFDIGKNYNDESLWEGLSNPIPNMRKSTRKSTSEDMEEEEEGFTVDAAYFGNVARFINHSCTPNLYAQNVLYDHDDQCMPHIMLFASEDIVPFEELTYHYNYTIDRVQGPDGTIKMKACYCGSIECTGRLY